MDINDRITLNDLSKDMKELKEGMNTLQQSVKPILDAYDSLIFGKSFLIGLATIIGSLAAIGGGVLWFVDYIRHGS